MRAVVLVLAGCSAAPHTTAATPPPPAPVVPAPAVRDAPAPELARPELSVFLPDPLVALDPDHAEPWPCKAKAREGAIGGYGLAIPAHQPLDVVTVERERLRVAIDHAGGRVLVWVPRGAFIASVVRETAAATRPGGPLPRSFDPGIFVGPGADVDDGRDGWWHLRATSELALDGWIPNDAVADWYLPPRPPGYSTFGFGSYESRSDGHGLIVQGTVVRATPHADGLALATVLVDHDIQIGRQHGDWRELDLDDDGVRVHGFIPEAAWHPYPSPYGVSAGSGRGGSGLGTIGVGRGIGRSRPRPVPTVRSGTCIVDADGNRIGRVTRDLFEPMPPPDAGGRIPVPGRSPALWYRRCY